jgi:uncharacterized protein with HEPN domain
MKKHIDELFQILAQYSVTDRKSFVSTAESNLVFQRAVLMSVGYIGELSKKLDDAFKAEHPEINWRRLGTSRNTIFHDYDIVDMKIISTVVFKDVNALRTALASDSAE